MRRTLAEWASIAEILGAVAIVTSLVFVGLEIRENTRATRAATLQQSVGYEIGLLSDVAAAEPSVAARYAWISQGNDVPLDGVANHQAQIYYIAALRLFEDVYLQWEAGTLSEDAWESRQGIIEAFANGPGLETFLDSGFLSAGFEEYLKGLRTD